jgi:hypothetical protein
VRASTAPRGVLLALSSFAACAQAMAGHINVGASLVSGEVTVVENRKQVSRAELSQSQLQGLFHWLEIHRSGWYPVITPAGPLPPSYLSLDFKYSGGRTASIRLSEISGGGHTLFLTSSDKWAYESFLGILKTWAASRPVSNKEFTAIQELSVTPR